MYLSADVRVVDDLFSPEFRDQLIKTVSWVPVHFLNRWERFKSHELDIHWYYPIAFTDEPFTEDVESELAALDETLHPIVVCWRLVKSRLGFPVRLYECSISANTFGTEGRVHHDIDLKNERARHMTVLVFCTGKWDPNWAGETVFFDDSGEVSAAVLPSPGRSVIVSGDPLHVGRSVSRTCPSDRRVLVFKFWRVMEQEGLSAHR